MTYVEEKPVGPHGAVYFVDARRGDAVAECAIGRRLPFSDAHHDPDPGRFPLECYFRLAAG